MTPDAAFGHERAGTPAAVAELGRREGFDVVLVPPFTLEGREVRSSEIRSAIGEGNLRRAAELLGRPYAICGDVDDAGRVSFAMPVALPPAGTYRASVPGASGELIVGEGGSVELVGATRGRLRMELTSG
jgi:hypothetical protein